MIFMDYFPFLLYFLLSYSKDTSQNIAGHWVQNTVSGFSNSPPKGGTGGSIDSPKPQNIVNPLKTVSLRSLKVARGLRMSANISLSIQKVPQLPRCFLIWLGQYILYCINTRPCFPNKSSYLPTLTSVSFSNWEYPLELKCSTYTLFRYYILISSVIFIIPITWADCSVLSWTKFFWT